MTDRELLELAAKAADVDVIPDSQGIFWLLLKPGQKINSEWNPLTDDGDALRLAVQLGIEVYTGGYRLASAIHQKTKAYGEAIKGDDPYAATRRAIVRASAEIERNK